MNREEAILSLHDTVCLSGTDNHIVAILAVGDSEEWLRQGHLPLSANSIAYASIEEVTRELMNRLCPTVVISPALSHRFDCIDLAQILHKIGFNGRYRAVSTELPNPEMVRREIGYLCPGLDFAVLTAD